MATECGDEFWPCSSSIGGKLFLTVVYSVILAGGAKLTVNGSELLLELFTANLIGGLLLPVFGALPDVAIIFVSGIGDDAQTKLSVGMGSLAGSNVLMLTLFWAISVTLGRCDISPVSGTARAGTCTRTSLLRSGVTVYSETRILAKLMMVTLLPYIVIQIAHAGSVARDDDGGPLEEWTALAMFILCSLMFALYSVYLMWNPALQRRRLEAARKQMALAQLLRKARKRKEKKARKLLKASSKALGFNAKKSKITLAPDHKPLFSSSSNEGRDPDEARLDEQVLLRSCFDAWKLFVRMSGGASSSSDDDILEDDSTSDSGSVSGRAVLSGSTSTLSSRSSARLEAGTFELDSWPATPDNEPDSVGSSELNRSRSSLEMPLVTRPRASDVPSRPISRLFRRLASPKLSKCGLMSSRK
eukprot:TRINITY_DN19297_c0_g1_i1.p1 TRINITY_DN19297_c0_g1~~TRINITY_DN19297_c0_g1_i1.p1  ORF type:complete len:416 (+),score=80.37 TRINITY_DN19297_c0_g1_i1:96-1343(+)